MADRCRCCRERVVSRTAFGEAPTLLRASYDGIVEDHSVHGVEAGDPALLISISRRVTSEFGVEEVEAAVGGECGRRNTPA